MRYFIRSLPARAKKRNKIILRRKRGNAPRHKSLPPPRFESQSSLWSYAFDLFRLMGDAESEKYHLYMRSQNSCVGRPNFVLIPILSPAPALKFTSGNRPWWRGRKSLRLPTCARSKNYIIYASGAPAEIKRSCTPRYCPRNKSERMD
jgi:hypothetical protein